MLVLLVPADSSHCLSQQGELSISHSYYKKALEVLE